MKIIMNKGDNKQGEMGAFISFIDGEVTAERRIREVGDHVAQHSIPGSDSHEGSDPGVERIITFNDASIRLNPDPDIT